MAEKILFKRGTEENRKNIIPESGELIVTEDSKRVYLGDDSTPGGNLVGPIYITEWNFSSFKDTTEYSPSPDEKFYNPDNGVYIVFYGSSKLSKSDYEIDYVNNKMILKFTPEEDFIEISIYYMGL